MKINWRKIALLADAKNEVIEAFSERGWMVSFEESEPVLWEGDECVSVYFVHSGSVEIYRTSMDGREHAMRILHEGESFNLVPALMKEGENLANARCLSRAELLVVDRADLNSILSRFPHFAVHVLQVMADRLAGMTKLVGELALLTVRQRTAAFLMREADNATLKKGKNWTQDEMARQIGTVRDVIGRILRDFEKKGYIHRIRGNISLIDREGLERTAKGTK